MDQRKQSWFRLILSLLIVIAAGARHAAAQAPRRQATPNARLVSPEVHSDHRVTFRIYAPKASDITLRGDWMDTPEPARLEKDSQGIWSVTVGPLKPDYYSYTFSVDGVRTLDPRNPTIKQGITSLDSMFFLPGEEAAFQENRPVPHGEIRQVWYQSSTLGTQRRMHVYTPPGYESSRDRYPVFYLLHGGGDEDSGWSTIGRAGFILDNLLAEKKAKPMIVVMPNGSLPRPAAAGAPQNPASRASLQERFTNELMKDVIPFVERSYRVLTGRENRAIAGLSMGGGQTLSVITSHPDQFAYVGIWSAGIFGNAADFEQRNTAFLGSPDRVNRQVKLLAITIGDKDFLLNSSKTLSELLKRKGIKHHLQLTEGGHTWINWRRYLNEFAPQLFR